MESEIGCNEAFDNTRLGMRSKRRRSIQRICKMVLLPTYKNTSIGSVSATERWLDGMTGQIWRTVERSGVRKWYLGRVSTKCRVLGTVEGGPAGGAWDRRPWWGQVVEFDAKLKEDVVMKPHFVHLVSWGCAEWSLMVAGRFRKGACLVLGG